MNPYLKHLSKIEFVVTEACTGCCKHCSQGEHSSHSERIDPAIAAEAVKKVAREYKLQTAMVFGGEPLLHTEAVFAIMTAARDMKIPKRQVITNGFFSTDETKIRQVAETLAACGVNDLLLSVDAFHQETIPLDVVKRFAMEAKACNIPMRIQPAWLVSRNHNNPYNEATRELLDSFAHMEIPVSEGNIIFPEGNALNYLAEYFGDSVPENPYVEDPCDVRCVSVCANGDVLDGNLYERDVTEILETYHPKKDQ